MTAQSMGTPGSYINAAGIEYADQQEESKAEPTQGTLFQMMSGGVKNPNKSIAEKR